MSINDFAPGRPLTILLTGGRAPVALELARSFHRAGHRVLAAESARYHLCRVSRAVERSFQVPSPNTAPHAFLDSIESILVQEQVDVLIPTCEELFWIAKGLSRLSRHCTVWVSPIDQLEPLHNKWTFVQLAERLGLPVPQTRLIETPEEGFRAAGGCLEHKLVLKPVYSRFASKVLYLSKADSQAKQQQLLRELASEVSPAAPWVAQRHINGRHLCTYSIALGGELLAHAAYPCQYRVGQGAAVYYEPIEHAGALDWVRQFVRSMSFTGQIAFDFIEEPSGRLFAIECNPRATSGIHLFGTSGELVQAFLQPQQLRASGTMLTPSSSAMLTAPMIAAGLTAVRSLRELRSWVHAFRGARDVVFSATDRKPCAEQLRIVWEAWRISRKRGIKLVHATTIDMEWNGEA